MTAIIRGQSCAVSVQLADTSLDEAAIWPVSGSTIHGRIQSSSS